MMWSPCIICYRPVGEFHPPWKGMMEGMKEGSPPPTQKETTAFLMKRFFQLMRRHFNDDDKLGGDAVILEGVGFLSCCEDCSKLVESFCDLYHQMKSIELLLNWKMWTLANIMSCAARVPSRVKYFREHVDQLEIKNGAGADEILSFKKELIKKSRHKLRKTFPKVVLSNFVIKIKVEKVPDSVSPAVKLSIGDYGDIVEPKPSTSHLNSIINEGAFEEGDEMESGQKCKLEEDAAEGHQGWSDDDLKKVGQSDSNLEELLRWDPATAESSHLCPATPISEPEPFHLNENCGEPTTPSLSPASQAMNDPQQPFTFPDENSSDSPQLAKDYTDADNNTDAIQDSSMCNEDPANGGSSVEGTIPEPLIIYKSSTAEVIPPPQYIHGSIPETGEFQFQYNCPFCPSSSNRQFQSKSDWELHLERKHAWYKCSLCGRTFAGRNAYELHYQKTHMRNSWTGLNPTCSPPSPLSREQPQKVGVSVIDINPETGHYKCGTCSKEFASHQACIFHQRDAHPQDSRYKCPKCEKTYASPNLCNDHYRIIHLRERGGYQGTSRESGSVFIPATGKYKCLTCSKEYSTGEGSKRHHKSVHLKLRHGCAPCGKEFRSRAAYNFHHQSVHMGVRYRCVGCGKLFKSKPSLHTHVRLRTCVRRRIKSSPEPLVIIDLDGDSGKESPKFEVCIDSETGKYKCAICSKLFVKRRSGQLHHESVHLKIRYKCPACAKEFGLRSAYKVHHQSFHMGVKRRFQCNKCSKQFNYKGGLLRHQRKTCGREDMH